MSLQEQQLRRAERSLEFSIPCSEIRPAVYVSGRVLPACRARAENQWCDGPAAVDHHLPPQGLTTGTTQYQCSSAPSAAGSTFCAADLRSPAHRRTVQRCRPVISRQIPAIWQRRRFFPLTSSPIKSPLTPSGAQADVHAKADPPSAETSSCEWPWTICQNLIAPVAAGPKSRQSSHRLERRSLYCG